MFYYYLGTRRRILVISLSVDKADANPTVKTGCRNVRIFTLGEISLRNRQFHGSDFLVLILIATIYTRIFNSVYLRRCHC